MGRRVLLSLLWMGLVAGLLGTACSSGGGGDGASAPAEEEDPGVTDPGDDPTDPGDEPSDPPPPDPSPSASIEGCVGCHGEGRAVPVANNTQPGDAHFVDPNPAGPLTASGYRALDTEILTVDVGGTSVVIEFEVRDELGVPVPDLLAADGRFALARLLPPVGIGDPTRWDSLITRIENPGTVGDGPGLPAVQATAEGFTSGVFEALGGGLYRYTSAFDPTTGGIVAGETLRLAIQLSAGDLPADNGICDFDASLVAPNDCVSPVSLTRDIVQTATCNGCHGVTSETRLALHGGGRTDVEYCVTCHNPGSTDANSGNTVDMTVMIHKIHAGSTLENGYKIWGFRNTLHDYSNVNYTKDLVDCRSCHTDMGADSDSWRETPTREACGSCHDDVNFDTGENHGSGGAQLLPQDDNRFCSNCHPADGVRTAALLPVDSTHSARAVEAALYQGPGNGYRLESVVYDPLTNSVQADFAVVRDGVPLDLASAPQFGPGGRLALYLAWNNGEFDNVGSGATPAQPVSVNALSTGGAVSALGGGTYRAVIPRPTSARGAATVHLEGHPVADFDNDGSFEGNVPVRSVFASLDVDGGRGSSAPRRVVVDSAKCNQCHDAGGAGLAIHGDNRVGEIQVCTVCHNPDATDVNRRPDDPTTTPDGKEEVSIDLKRIIHQIHSGVELENGLFVYGFGGRVNDFSKVNFIGNRQNCETCHLPGTYSTEAAGSAAPSTIDTGSDLATPVDDLNISPTAATCESCHDDAISRGHMEQNGASFSALDADIR